MRRVRAGLAALALLLAGRVSADASWLSVASSERCAADRDELAARVADAVAGAVNPDVSIEVEVGGGARTTAVVRLMRGLELLGVRRIAGSSCDEALAAVVAVTALALSSTAPEAPSTPAQAVPASAEPVSAEARAPPLIDDDDDDDDDDDAPQPEPAEPTEQRWRMLAGVGMDVGTLEAATVSVHVGASLRLGPGEARALARYGLPTSQQEREEATASASTGRSASLRADFAAAALDYCLGIDAAHWLGACGGVELAMTRRMQIEQAGGLARERERVALSLGPVAGVALVLRAVPLQPQLELAAQWPAIGARPAAQPFGLRAIFGGAVSF